MIVIAIDKIRYSPNGNQYILALIISIFAFAFFSVHFIEDATKHQEYLRIQIEKFEILAQSCNKYQIALEESQENLSNVEENLIKGTEMPGNVERKSSELIACLRELNESTKKEIIQKEIDALTTKLNYLHQREVRFEKIRRDQVKKIASILTKIANKEKKRNKLEEKDKHLQPFFEKMQNVVNVRQKVKTISKS